jgi:hypothetical protein
MKKKAPPQMPFLAMARCKSGDSRLAQKLSNRAGESSMPQQFDSSLRQMGLSDAQLKTVMRAVRPDQREVFCATDKGKQA